MLELLEACWGLLSGVFASLWGLVASVGGFGWDLLMWLHVETPRLEGLLVGVLLAWLLARRDSHPLIRVLSAPLKLVLDILDLAWDQAVEVVGDLWETSKDWLGRSVGWVKGKLVGGYGSVMGWLGSIKDKLSKKED